MDKAERMKLDSLLGGPGGSARPSSLAQSEGHRTLMEAMKLPTGRR